MSASSVAPNPIVAAAIVVRGYDQVTKNQIDFFAGLSNATIINSLKEIIPKAGERGDKITAPIFDKDDVGDYLKKLRTFGRAKPGFDMAIKYKKPSVDEPSYVRIRNTLNATLKSEVDELVRDFKRAWEASDGLIISKLLESCKDVDAAEQIVLHMSAADKSAAEILDKLLGDYDKSSAQRAITIRKQLEDVTFDENQTVKEFIGVCEQKRAELERAGGAYSNNEMIDLILTKGQANERYKLFFLTYDASSSVNATVVDWPTFRAWAIKLDNKVKSTVIEPTVTVPTASAANADQEPVGQKRPWVDRRGTGFRGRGRGPMRGGRGGGGRYGYMSNNYNRDVFQPTPVPFTGDCFSCGQPGHTQRFCPSRPFLQQQQQQTQYSARDNNNVTRLQGTDGGRQVSTNRPQGIIYQENQRPQSRLYHEGRYTNDEVNHAAADSFMERYSTYMMTDQVFALVADKDALLDSGASDNFVMPTTRVRNFRQSLSTLNTAQRGSTIKILGEGTLGSMSVKVVDQTLKKQLVSVAKLTDMGYTLTFDRNGCTLSKGTFSKTLPRVDNLYPIDFSDVPEASGSI